MIGVNSKFVTVKSNDSDDIKIQYDKLLRICDVYLPEYLMQYRQSFLNQFRGQQINKDDTVLSVTAYLKNLKNTYNESI